MKILFVHQNFPAQFKHLAPALAGEPGNTVVALNLGRDSRWRTIRIAGYEVQPPDAIRGLHPWLEDLNVKLMRAEAAGRRAIELREAGFTPDVILAHPGWGEALLLKEVWPRARLALFCEFYYHAEGGDVGFDPEFPSTPDSFASAARIKFKNANQLLSFEDACRGLSPTQWQRSQYPGRLQPMIDVIHDGIDTQALRANRGVKMTLNKQLTLTRSDEIITFVNRNLEPYRGYHVFMRALPEILSRRPRARVILVGGNDVSYGARPPAGKSWRDIFLDEVRDRLDLSRVHFVGKLRYPDFVQLLQLSAAHVYLTYPFVLSWSLLEAMSVGCPIVASRTPPVEEALEHRENALLVDFFDRQGLADAVCTVLEDRRLADRLGAAARASVIANYDLRTRCLPAQLDWVSRL